MQKQRIFSFLTVILLIISSCAREVDLHCSCDKETNDWVNSNVNRIRTFKRTDVLNMSSERMRASFKAFTPEQRYQFWQDKIEQVLSLNDWKPDEKEFLMRIKGQMQLSWFANDLIADTVRHKKVMDALSQWKIEADSVLKWDRKLTYGILVSPYNLKNHSGDLTIGINSPTKVQSVSSENTCNCTVNDNWCSHSSSDPYDRVCINRQPCEGDSIGCGTLWLSPCNGNCAHD